MEMTSTNHGYKHDQTRQRTVPRGSDDGTYAHPDPVVGNSGYYEDLDKTTVNKEREYQSIDNDIPENEKQRRRHQNAAMSGNQGQTQVSSDYDLPESDGGKKQQGNYEELDKKGMEKDHEYQALSKGETKPPPYQNVKI